MLEQLKDSDSNRVYKKYDEISPYMGKAFVAIEDERFYKHNGIDIQGIIRAGVNGVAHGFHFTEGASTLTQQLIKNNVFPNFINESKYQRIERKIQEQYLALKIEKEMSKEEILEAYMNTINLGQGCLGVQTAAQRYFNKDAKDLTLSECAVIAAITQSPSNLNPVSNPENNAKRREKVLKNMKEQGFITKDEYDEAIADNVYDRISETASNTTASKPYTYFIDAVINQIVDDLVTEKSYTETQAYNLLYSGGLTIKVTQDADIQAICDDEVANVGDYLNGDTEYGLITHLLSTGQMVLLRTTAKNNLLLIFRLHGDMTLLFSTVLKKLHRKQLMHLNQRSISMRLMETLLMRELSSHLSRRLLLL